MRLPLLATAASTAVAVLAGCADIPEPPRPEGRLIPVNPALWDYTGNEIEPGLSVVPVAAAPIAPAMGQGVPMGAPSGRPGPARRAGLASPARYTDAAR